MSDAISCPSQADYTCYALTQPTAVEVGPEALRITTQKGGAFVEGPSKSFVMSGSVTKGDLVSMLHDTLTIINDRTCTLCDPSERVCMRARVLGLVNLDGSTQRVLELLWGATFRVIGKGDQAQFVALLAPYNLGYVDSRSCANVQLCN
jgi:hypothetical protein